MCPAKAGQSGAVGTKSGPSGPSEDLWGPQKGHFGPKRSLLGPLGAQKGPDTRSKCVVSMSLTQTGQSGAVGTKSGPPGPSEVPERTFYGQNGPFLPLFFFLLISFTVLTILFFSFSYSLSSSLSFPLPRWLLFIQRSKRMEKIHLPVDGFFPSTSRRSEKGWILSIYR